MREEMKWKRNFEWNLLRATSTLGDTHVLRWTAKDPYWILEVKGQRIEDFPSFSPEDYFLAERYAERIEPTD